MAEHYDYALLIFALAAYAFGLHALLAVRSCLAVISATVLTFLAVLCSVIAIMHFWRYHGKGGSR